MDATDLNKLRRDRDISREQASAYQAAAEALDLMTDHLDPDTDRVRLDTLNQEAYRLRGLYTELHNAELHLSSEIKRIETMGA